MRHPTDGTLRRLLDEPAGVADADREHVADCPVCRAAVCVVRDDANLAVSVCDASADASGVDVDAAWLRLSNSLTADVRRDAVARTAPPGRRSRLVPRRPVVAAFGVAALLTGAGVAAAADWLPIFRTERIVPVVLDQNALVQLPDLSAYGELEIVEAVDVREVADAAAAEEATGLDAPEVGELPTGVIGDPTYHAGEQVSAVFTFSADRAAKAAAEAGETLPPPPPGLDGSQFRLVAGPGVAAVWTEARGVPALIVGRAVAPTGYSSSVPFEIARDYFLALPGLPDDVADQLRSFSADGTTLPLPLGDPNGEMTTSDVEVNGVPATAIEVGDGAVSGVVWVDDGIVTAVAGLLSVDEVLTVARGLN